MNWICLNGDMLPASSPAIMYDDKSFRYGDGIFETMKFVNGRIPLGDLHFERLFSSLKLLRYDLPTVFSRHFLEDLIQKTAEKNNHSQFSRVRLTISRGNGHIRAFQGQSNFLIETYDIERLADDFSNKGVTIGVFEDGRKSIDRFSNLKSSGCLIYSIASFFAKENDLDDCLILNTHNRIADSCIANIFLVRNNLIITPSLSEGVVNGVMRRFLLSQLPSILPGIEVREGVVTKSDLEVFDEAFLTNAIQGVKWIEGYKTKKFTNDISLKIHDFLQSTFHS